MPLLGPFNTFTDGTTTSADLVMENFYSPAASPDSMEAINGWLNEANALSFPSPGAWDVNRTQIRPQSMSRARMVGLTAHADYLDTMSEDLDQYVPIHGAGLSFYLPRSPSVLLLTWQIIGAGDEFYGPGSSNPDIAIKAFVDGSALSSQLRFVAPASYTVASETFRLTDRDRIWSGHASFLGANALSAGWHGAYIGVKKGNGAVQARFRIRNMKYIAFF
jgi:hypothetical protein